MSANEKAKENKTAQNETDDDISSLRTLEFEVSEYLGRSDSTAYHELYPGVEMIDYDFVGERQNLYATNLVESTAHLVKGCIGAGILGIHEAYMYGGIWTSLSVTTIFGFLISYCMLMLVKSAQKMYLRLRVPRLSYPDLAEVALATGPLKLRRFSKAFRYLVDMFLFLEFNGTCCIFEIIIAKTLKEVLEAASSIKISISLYILIVTLPLIALSLIRSLKYLAPFSLAADLIIALCVATTMYYSLTIASNLSERPAWKSIHGFFNMLGVCMYSINGIGVVLPIENNMRRPQYFNTVLQFGMPIVICFVMIIGFFGYWAWGENCRSPFTIHMPSYLSLLIMQGLLTITLGVTFAVHFWVPFRIIWHYVGKNHDTRRELWERLYRALHVMVIACLSIALPNIVTWMSFLGNFFSAVMVFIFPSLIEILITWKEPRKYRLRWSLVKNISLVILGTVLCGGGWVLIIL
ncbi:proton-coupled amino acid transporter-like protein pathetic [Nymphalis io]|uniref:proton-coupled amino acid transporter-like protein pathetic n=1 Tax=Inachis io TaxID=171585 RepID=UPI002169F567|nr:proton-coupled amino acid transporter-like protein pathetic [Nymphalis io]